MNDDRCYHVPTSPGQTVCTCLDYAMWLRFVIQTQAAYIADLERRMHTVAPRVIEPHVSSQERYLRTLEAMNPSPAVQRAIDDIRAEPQGEPA